MKRIFALLAMLTAPAAAAPGGAISTLTLGNWLCELPGDATGAVGRRVPGEEFSIVNASSYATPKGRGTYLLTGDIVTMTSGPKRGQRFHLISQGFMRKIGPDGQDSDLRCVRRVVNNG